MKGLTDYQKFLVVRPLPPNTELDRFNNPVIKRDNLEKIDWSSVRFTSLTNLSSIKAKSKYIPLLFHYDYVLERMWNDPLKYLSKFSGFLAVTNPDYSVYTNMNIKEVEHNVFRNRWFAVWAQYYHYKVIPTVSWGTEETYDLCFEGLPKESVVMISTVGCLRCEKDFLAGYAEMLRRLNPSLIIVRGKPIDGMSGNLLFVDFEDTFNTETKKQVTTCCQTVINKEER